MVEHCYSLLFLMAEQIITPAGPGMNFPLSSSCSCDHFCLTGGSYARPITRLSFQKAKQRFLGLLCKERLDRHRLLDDEALLAGIYHVIIYHFMHTT